MEHDEIRNAFPELLERFVAKIELAVDGSGCWLYQGACDPKGYPNVKVPRGFPGSGRSRTMKGLRVSMALFRGIVLGARQAHHYRDDCAKECVCPDHGVGETPLEHYRHHHPDADTSEWAAREALIW
jgi:hypothetical protein